MTAKDEPRSLKELENELIKRSKRVIVVEDNDKKHPAHGEQADAIKEAFIRGTIYHVEALLQRTRARLIEEGMKMTNEATERGVKRHREWAYFWKIELIDDLLSTMKGIDNTKSKTKERKK